MKPLERKLKQDADQTADRMTTKSFKVPDDLIAALAAEAGRLKVSEAAIIRAALRLALGLS